jgi:hypothetical protein
MAVSPLKQHRYKATLIITPAGRFDDFDMHEKPVLFSLQTGDTDQ